MIAIGGLGHLHQTDRRNSILPVDVPFVNGINISTGLLIHAAQSILNPASGVLVVGQKLLDQLAKSLDSAAAWVAVLDEVGHVHAGLVPFLALLVVRHSGRVLIDSAGGGSTGWGCFDRLYGSRCADLVVAAALDVCGFRILLVGVGAQEHVHHSAREALRRGGEDVVLAAQADEGGEVVGEESHRGLSQLGGGALVFIVVLDSSSLAQVIG